VVSVTSASNSLPGFSTDPLASSKEIVSLSYQSMTLVDEIGGHEVIVSLSQP
jgi:hypothetical protein